MAKEVPLITNQAGADGRKRTLSPLLKLGPMSLRVLGIASAASLLLFYLAQTTQSATKSYELQTLNQHKAELTEETDRLELEAQRLQSLGAIQSSMGDSLSKDYEPAKDLKSVN